MLALRNSAVLAIVLNGSVVGADSKQSALQLSKWPQARFQWSFYDELGPRSRPKPHRWGSAFLALCCCWCGRLVWRIGIGTDFGTTKARGLSTGPVRGALKLFHPRHQSSHLRMSQFRDLCRSEIDVLQTHPSLPPRHCLPTELRPKLRPRFRALPEL